ncbi:hypothetical protein M4C05_25155 [Klebsiella pneumoniae]|nr:hypothetical protein [Klebsiella pneumoniae]
MPDIIPHQQQPERLHKFHSLKGGQYWRAKIAIPEQCIEQDDVLLIESLRWVDNALHTVILRTHPSKFGKDFVFKLPMLQAVAAAPRNRLKSIDFCLMTFWINLNLQMMGRISGARSCLQLKTGLAS